MKKFLLAFLAMLLPYTNGFCEPTLIILSGPPGWGKTTLSQRLAAEFNFVRLDFDSIAEPFSPGVRDANYAVNIEPKVADALLNLAKYNFASGHNVIIDGTWSHLFCFDTKYMDMVQKVVEESGIKLIVLQGILDEKTILERIRLRNDSRDHPKLANPEQFFINDHVRIKNPLEPHYEISGRGSAEEVFKRAKRILRDLL